MGALAVRFRHRELLLKSEAGAFALQRQDPAISPSVQPARFPAPVDPSGFVIGRPGDSHESSSAAALDQGPPRAAGSTFVVGTPVPAGGGGMQGADFAGTTAEGTALTQIDTQKMASCSSAGSNGAT